MLNQIKIEMKNKLFSSKAADVKKVFEQFPHSEYGHSWTLQSLVSTKRSHVLKAYLYYKTITSQNVPSEAQIKNFFILKKLF